MTELKGFLRDLVDQQRAGDTYGQLDRLSDDLMLRPFVARRQGQKEIPIGCDVDPATELRIRSFYQAVAAGVERATGVRTTVAVDINAEGFGRIVIFAGRLVAVSDVLRDAQRFGFAATEQLAERGETLVARGVQVIATHPEAARDES